MTVNMYEPLFWMGQVLGFIIMAASMGVWRQVATVAGTLIGAQASWTAIIGLLMFQAASRAMLGLSVQIDPRMLSTMPWLAPWGGPFQIVALALGAASLLLLLPLWEAAVLKLGSGKAAARFGALAGVGLSSWAVIRFSAKPSDFIDLSACAAVASAGLCMLIFTVRGGKAYSKAGVAWFLAVLIGISLGFGSINTNAPGLGAALGSMAGSLALLAGMHLRVEKLSKGRIKSSAPSALRHWFLAWGLLVAVGPSVLALSGNGGGSLYQTDLMSLGLIAAFVAMGAHFNRLNAEVAHYIEKLGSDRGKALLSGIDVAAFLVDHEERVVECSVASEPLTEMSVETLVGSNVWAALDIDPVGNGRFEGENKKGKALVVSSQHWWEADKGWRVVTARDVTSEKQAEKALDKAAREDDLTGLPNRREGLMIVDQAISDSRGEKVIGLLFMDLDHFKNVNDTSGHAEGDALLREVAGLLNESVKESGGWLARLGGDEFLGVISGTDANECEQAAYRCIASLERSERAAKGSVGISVGCSLYPRDGDNGIDLVRRADAAMYEAKGEGRGRVSFFCGQIEQRLLRRVQVESFLREALRRGQGLVLHLQPLCSMDGLFLGHAEALVRAPGMPGLGAQELVDVAERSGLIMALGRWVLGEAGRVQREADKRGIGLTLSVNVSAKQFMDELFWEQFRGMARLGQFKKGVVLEVTETSLMEDMGRAARLLSEARSLGAQIALDDFGVGYSSLSMLKRMPLDKIKLDKSLIDDVASDQNAGRVTQAAIAMAEALGLGLVAEGIESQEQADWLKAKGVGVAQGHLFAKAMEQDKLFELAQGAGPHYFFGEPK